MIRPTVDRLIASWLKAHGRSDIPLVVAHSHSHGDHIAGDAAFRERPNTTIVGLKPAEVEIGTKVYKLEAQCLVLSGDRLVSDDELTSMLQEHYARFFKEELGID